MPIIDLKGQHDDVIKEKERLSNQLQDWEAYCATFEVELAFLRCELENAKKQLSQYKKNG